MHKALVYRADPDASKQLQADMRGREWRIEVCDGMLQMLRLIEASEYDIVILDISHMSVEVSTLLEIIKALEKTPKILLNLTESDHILPTALLALDYPLIRGTLTSDKFLEAVQDSS